MNTRTPLRTLLTLIAIGSTALVGTSALAADTPVSPPPAPLAPAPAPAPITAAPITAAPTTAAPTTAKPTVTVPSVTVPLVSISSPAPSPAPQVTATQAKVDHMALGRAAKDKKDWKTAIVEFQAAVDEDPGNADAHNLLAYSYRKSGNLPMAFTHYEIALRLNPDHRGAHEYRGEAYVQAGDLVKAKADLAALERICGKTCEQYVDLLAVIQEAEVKMAAPSAIAVTTVVQVPVDSATTKAPAAKPSPMKTTKPKAKAPKRKK